MQAASWPSSGRAARAIALPSAREEVQEAVSPAELQPEDPPADRAHSRLSADGRELSQLSLPASLDNSDESSAEDPFGSSSTDTDEFADPCGPSSSSCSVCDRWAWRHMAHVGRVAAQKAKDGGPKPQRLPGGTWVTAKFWGITKGQLQDFFNECREDPRWNDADSVATFVPKFVKPRTDGTGMGLALLLNQKKPARVNLMISHAWQENAKCFFEDVLKHILDFEMPYICFLSNYQGTREEIDAQLGKDLSRSPFTDVLSSFHCHRLLVVPNEELRENGEGLYSRLWCDWEIKVAADMGLPIHITDRHDLSYLLGSKSQSSKNARCGDPRLPPNEDELLIRQAIKTKPVENGKFQSLGVFVFSICVAYGPRVAVQCFGPKYGTWMAGYPGGIAVGMIFIFGVLRPARKWFYNLRDQDGYRKLDSIIKAAANREYYHRRFRPSFDIPLMAAVSVTGGLLNLLIKFKDHHKVDPDCKDEYIFFAILSGLYEGIVIWPVLHFNSIGPWTGVFVLELKRRILIGVYLTCMCIGSSVLFEHVLLKHGDGLGTLWGLLTGLGSISLAYQKWKHAAGMALVLGYMVGCYFLMKYIDCWLLWRDTILVALGALGLQMVPGLSLRQNLAAWGVCPCFVVGLAVLSLNGSEKPLKETCMT